MKHLPASLMMLMLVTASCGGNKNDNLINDEPNQGSSKETAKINTSKLKSKYNKLSFNCNLNTEKNTGSETSWATDSLHWDLLNNSSSKREFKLKSQGIENYELKVWLKVTEIEVIEKMTYQDSEGTVYEMKSTPQLSIDYGSDSIIKYASGATFKAFENGSKILNEGINTSLFSTSSITPVSSDQYSRELNCTIVSEVKPEFQDQYKVIKKN